MYITILVKQVYWYISQVSGERLQDHWSSGSIVVEPAYVRPFTFSNIFFSETAWPMKAKFCVEHPWVGGTKVCSQDLDHMTKMAATPIYHPGLPVTGNSEVRGTQR